MKKLSLTNVWELSRFTWKSQRRTILGWTAAVFSILFLYMILFPTVQDMAQVKMQAMPKELLQLMGMESFEDMGNYLSYFGIIYNLVLVIISVFGATFGARVLLQEEKSKSIEFLNALAVSRQEIYWGKCLACLGGVMLVSAAGIAAACGCGYLTGGETFIPQDFWKMVGISCWIPLFFTALSLALAGSSARWGGGGTSGMVVAACYLLGYLSTLLGEKGEWLAYLSPFQAISPAKALAGEQETVWILGIYLLLGLLFVLWGAVAYGRRDFRI